MGLHLHMRTQLLTASIICTLSITSVVDAQTITYKWMNMGCASMIMCEQGCAACNLPENSSSGFFGTNSIWIGTSTCPYPGGNGSTVIHSYDWPVFPENGSYAMLSGIATTPMQVDSIIIRHTRTAAGPQRLKVSFARSPMEPMMEISDAMIDQNFTETVITGLDCLPFPPGAPHATFQLKMQPYDSAGDGAWVLDEIRIVGSTCASFSTDVHEFEEIRSNDPRPYVDVLGRPVGSNAAPGVYLGGKRVVVVQ